MTSTQTGKDSALAAAVEALRKAMIAADGSALDKLAAAEPSYGHSSGRLEDKAQFIEGLTSGKSSFGAIELADQTINVLDRIALVRHTFTATRRKENDKVKLCILTVWRQEQDQWKLLARQAAKL